MMENSMQKKPNTKFQIRHAVWNDIPQILDIFSQARNFMAEHGNGGQWGKTYPNREVVMQDLAYRQLYLCLADGKIAAVFVYFEREEPSYAKIWDGQWLNTLPYGVIHRVAAAKWARGLGAPAFCLEWAYRRCGNLRIDTHENNIPMQNLIQKCGFSYCGRIQTEDGGERIAFQKTARLILASASPRRKELMQKLEQPFLCDPAKGEEAVPDGLPASEIAGYLSRKKAEEVYNRHKGEKGAVVIGADTVVLCGKKPLGKPKDAEDAFKLLKMLSGTEHTVCTGVCICYETGTETFVSETKVRFYPLEDAEIRAYIATGEPMDKAGAYGIQGEGALLVKELSGDYYTVVGLPVAELARRLHAIKR